MIFFNHQTDVLFILALLRRSKFNVAKACKILESILIDRQIHPQWYRNLDVENRRMMALVDTGYAYLLKDRDELGRRIVMVCPANFDTDRFNFADLMKLFVMIFHLLMLEEVGI
jgi:hypothetical protein